MTAGMLLIPAVFAGDKIIKDRAEKKLKKSGDRSVLKGGVRFKLCRNYGAMLNFADRHPDRVRKYSFFMSTGLTIIYLYFLLTGRGSAYRAALTLALGGVYSNTFDRFYRGYVVDYISFPAAGKLSGKFCGKKAGDYIGGIVFNISDFFIIAGEIAAIAAAISGESF